MRLVSIGTGDSTICKLLGNETFSHFRDVLERLPSHPRERIAELTPRPWKAARDAAALE